MDTEKVNKRKAVIEKAIALVPALYGWGICSILEHIDTSADLAEDLAGGVLTLYSIT